MIRKATREDIPAVEALYDEIHTREEAREVTTGWIRGVYPVRETAEAAVRRDDLFVQEDEDGRIIGTAILNQIVIRQRTKR